MRGLRIVPPGEGRPWWWQGCIVRMPATGEDTGQRFMIEEATVPPGGGPAPHIQNREDESFYVVDGGPVEFTAGNRKATLGAGGFVVVGKGTAHVFRNIGEAPARILIWNFPAGFERFQLEAGEAPRDLEQPRRATGQDRQRAMRLAPEFGIDLHPDAGAFEREPVLRIVEPDAAGGRPIAGQTWIVLAAAEDTGGAFSMYRVAVPPGEPAPQPFEVDVALFTLAGTLGIQAGEEFVEAAPGTLVQVPAHTPLGCRGTNDQRATMLIWTAPAHDLAAAVAPP